MQACVAVADACSALSSEILRDGLEFPEHLIHTGDSMAEHLFVRTDFYPRRGVCGAVASQLRRFNRWEISVISVRITEKEAITHGTALPPLPLKIDKRLARHSDDSDPLID